MRLYRREILVCFFLIIATLSVFGQVRSHDFVNYDDNTYVTENSNVQAGLGPKNIVWAFTTTYANFWHPLTWFSHMLDCRLFGLNPGMHHLSSLMFHIINTILLFLVLRAMTGSIWRSAFVAVLFALHPLHVESVAWVSERKDLVSTLFWLLTMGSYLWYIRHPGINRYLPVLFFFVMGLMAKPMLVTLPFVLLLLDYWPLNRIRFGRPGMPAEASRQESTVSRLILEKLPFFILTAAFCAVAFIAQQKGGATGSLETYPVGVRITNAFVSYVGYIGKMIWPHNLAVYYPHPMALQLWQAFGAGLLLVCVSMLSIREARRRPYLIVGWLWYIGTLVPVIGLVQLGSHAMADRYTYVPFIGLFVIVAWGVPEITARWRRSSTILALFAGTVILAMMICSWNQVRHWQNSITLFSHAVAVTSNNLKAYNNLGTAYLDKGNTDKAASSLSAAVNINPDNAVTQYNLGLVFMRQGKTEEAAFRYSRALSIKPDFERAHRDMGGILLSQGRYDEAIRHLHAAVVIDPGDVIARNKLGDALLTRGRIDEAILQFSEVLRRRPDYSAYYNMGNALLKKRRFDEAISCFAESLRMNPYNAMAHNNMGNALSLQGNFAEAVSHYGEALRIKPDFATVHGNLGIAMERMGNYEEAVKHFSEVLKLYPGDENTRKSLERCIRLVKSGTGKP